MNLRHYPVLGLRQRPKNRTRFILRIEGNIPTPIDGKLPIYRDILCETKQAQLVMLSTERRQLAYEFRLKQAGSLPKIIHKDWYVLAFYGTRISTAQILFQDTNLRLVRGGNGNFVGLIVRKQPKQEGYEMPLTKED